jgi:hypothetical protein
LLVVRRDYVRNVTFVDITDKPHTYRYNGIKVEGAMIVCHDEWHAIEVGLRIYDEFFVRWLEGVIKEATCVMGITHYFSSEVTLHIPDSPFLSEYGNTRMNGYAEGVADTTYGEPKNGGRYNPFNYNIVKE